MNEGISCCPTAMDGNTCNCQKNLCDVSPRYELFPVKEDSDPQSSEVLSDESQKTSKSLCKYLLQALQRFFLRNFLPICLTLSVIIGAVYPTPGVFLSQFPISYVIIVTIFLVNGVNLKTDELKSALKQYRAVLCAVVCTFVSTPLIGTRLTELLPYGPTSTASAERVLSNNTELSDAFFGFLGPGEIKIGFQLYYLMPCTLVTCFVLTAQIGGDTVVTVLISVLTNSLAVFTVPLMIPWLTSFDADISIDVEYILLKLILAVLLPFLVGKLLRFIGPLKRAADKYRKVTSLSTVVILCMIPWMKVSKTSASNALGLLSLPGIVFCIGWGTFIHLLFIFHAILLAFIFRLDRKGAKSVIITASSKTLSLLITVISFLPKAAGDQGLIFMPSIMTHLSIVVVDSLIISWVVSWEKKNGKTVLSDSDQTIKEEGEETLYITAV